MSNTIQTDLVVDQEFHSLFAPLGGGDPDDAKQAAESFDVLQAYYRRNFIWLPLRVSNQFSAFLARYRKPFNDFTSALMSRGYQPGHAEKWNEVWTTFQKESPEIRQTLETEFRAALGSYRAKLALLLECIVYVPLGGSKNLQSASGIAPAQDRIFGS